MQDRVTSNVVSAIEPNIRFAEVERARRKLPQSLQAYDLVLRAQPLVFSYARDGYEEASRLLRRAIEIDPTYALAAVCMAQCYFLPWQQGWIEARQPLDEIVRLTNLALEYGGEDPEVLTSAIHMVALPGGDLRGGLELAERSLALNPSSGYALTVAGRINAFAGDTRRAIDYLERAMRFNPWGWYPINYALALAHIVAGSYETAADVTGKLSSGAGSFNPLTSNIVVYVRLRAATLGLLGRIEEGRQAVERLLAISPKMTITLTRTYYEVVTHNLFKTPGVLDALCEGLRRMGLPE
jgi:adenylate cyclase